MRRTRVGTASPGHRRGSMTVAGRIAGAKRRGTEGFFPSIVEIDRESSSKEGASKINFRAVFLSLKRPSTEDINLGIWLSCGVALGWLLAWWFAASHVILANDTWWQIVAGKDILSGHWPVHNTWSWTLPRERWMVQEPLFDVLEAWASKRGYWGLSLLPAAFMAAGMGFLWDLLRRRSGDITALLLGSTALYLTLGAWEVRPQVADYLGLIVVLWAIGRGRFWVIPFSTVVWANLHSGAVISPLIMSVFLAVDLVPGCWLDRVRLEASGQWRKMVAPTAAAYLATLATHNGIGIWVYSVRTLFDSPTFAKYIQEWMPPDFGDPLTRAMFIAILLLLIFPLVLRKNIKLSAAELVLFVGFLFQSLGENRFIPYLYLLTIVMISPLWSWRVTTSVITKAIFFLALLTSFLYAISRHFGVPSPDMEIQAALEGYPVSAVSYIKDHHLGPVYNHYNWGGYLIYEGIPVYIDGRSEVYYWAKEDIFAQYINVQRLVDVDQGLKGANVVLDYKDSILVKYLLVSKQWKVLGSDRWGVVLGKVKE